MSPSSSPALLVEMAMWWVCHLKDHHFCLKIAFKWLLYFHSLDDNPLKYWKMASCFWKAISCFVMCILVSWSFLLVCNHESWLLYFNCVLAIGWLLSWRKFLDPRMLLCVLCLSVLAAPSVGLWWSSGGIFISHFHRHSLSSDLHPLSYLVVLLLLSYVMLAMHHM